MGKTILARFNNPPEQTKIDQDTKKEIPINTIEEHIDIINEYGFVWWGWWKREDEPWKRTFLNYMSARLNGNKLLNIGLYNLSDNEYYSAILEDIKIAEPKKRRLSPESNFTPEYYNEKCYPAWFKLKKIEKVNEKNFKKLFGEIPSSNDETLFEYPKKSRKILRTRRIPMRGDSILHLSDIHLGDDHGFPFKEEPGSKPILKIIENYFDTDEKKSHIGLIIISGDLITKADGNLLQNKANPFLHKLRKIFNLSTERIIIVPGNHDIPIKDWDSSDYSHETTYKEFLRTFYGKKKELTGIDKLITPSKIKIDILQIHSVKLREKKEMNYGFVDWDKYGPMITSGNLKPDSTKIAVLHHHLITIPTIEKIDESYPYGSISVTLDAGKVIEGLQNFGFNIVLHGHQHMPGHHKVSRGTIIDNNKIYFKNDLMLLGAGSMGAKSERLDKEFPLNSFSILKINKKNIKIETVQYNDKKTPSKYYMTEVEMNR